MDIERDQRRPSSMPIPWLGARKLARKLAADAQELRAQRDAARDQLERLGAMGRQLVAEVKELRAERELAFKQIEAGGL